MDLMRKILNGAFVYLKNNVRPARMFATLLSG